MKNTLHIALVFLLGLSVLAGCHREGMPGASDSVQQVTEGPVKVSLTLSLKGFGGDNVLTKGDFYEPGNDFVNVNDSLFYDHEKFVKDAGIFVFDADTAFVDDGGKFKFDPAKAEYKTGVKYEYIDVRDTLTRVEFMLDKPYKSLAVIVLANYHMASYSASGGNMNEIVSYLANQARAVSFVANQDEYISNGIPMHGWKVFGSLEGLPSSSSFDTDEVKKRRLKYYKGMTTPLTVVGFNDPARLEEYAKEGSGKGVVNEEDHIQMEFALSRLQLRYVPKDKAVSADSVKVQSVKLNVYKDQFRILPENWLNPALRPNPYTPTDDAGNFVSGDVIFKEISSKTGKSKAFVAYVPEISSASVDAAIAADPTHFKEPSLVVKIQAKSRERKDGWITYTYDRNKITVDDGTNPAQDYENYGDEGWVSWLQMKTVQEREDIDHNPVLIGTRYSLVRHYSYEWVAVGFNE